MRGNPQDIMLEEIGSVLRGEAEPLTRVIAKNGPTFMNVSLQYYDEDEMCLVNLYGKLYTSPSISVHKNEKPWGKA